MGIGTAALISSDWSPVQSACLIAARLHEQIIDKDGIYLYIFTIVISCLITLFNKNGCINSLASSITKQVKSARMIQTSSIFISFLLFIDDWLSILTTGFIMSPLTDRFGIARQKLAFLVHSLAGSVVILAPVSSWVGAITNYMSAAGIKPVAGCGTYIQADPFFMYLETIPFIFYSFLIIGSVFFIVYNSISYGPMRAYELAAHATVTSNPGNQEESSAPVSDLFIPIIVLVLGTFVGLLYTGNFYLFGGNNSFVDAIKNSGLCLSICVASIVALILGIVLSFMHKTITSKQVPSFLYEGTILMLPVIMMLFLATAFGVMLKNDICTGQYLATNLLKNIPIVLLPAMFFIVTIIITIAASGAWAAIALTLPIALPMLSSLLHLNTSATPAEIAILFPLLGAIFAGAVCGDHISPVCAATIVTASSTGVPPLEHAYTQFFYALPAVLCSIVAFLISGYLAGYPAWINCLCSLSVSMVICFAMLWLLNKNKVKS